MSQSEPNSPTKIRANFNRDLQLAIDTGQHPRSCSGLYPSVRQAISRVAFDYPKINPTLIRLAQIEFEKQAAGVLDRADADEWSKVLGSWQH